MNQMVIRNYNEFENYIEGFSHILLICGNTSFVNSDKLIRAFQNKGINYKRFASFKPNPTTEAVEAGIQTFKESNYDAIMAIGGGSAIDIAKCIKLYGNRYQESWEERLSEDKDSTDVPLIVMPTTAGSGSEATRFAVIYHKGIKQSITADAILPDTVLYDSSVLLKLSDYQKKATLFDALCHCIESFWSINSTIESQRYSKCGIKLILESAEDYWAGFSSDRIFSSLQKAAYLAGKAINITQTTAGHAMSYKMTSLYGCSHGHAVAMCVKELWPWMIENIDLCRDVRGQKYLEDTFNELSSIICGSLDESGVDRFNRLFDESGLKVPTVNDGDIDVLVNSVNPTRLKNSPIELSNIDIRMLYQRILKR